MRYFVVPKYEFSSQEMVAYGASSVVCSLFLGYIPAASVARSMVQDGAGGKTQVFKNIDYTFIRDL